MATFIIFCLHFLGCDTKSIFCVLESYQLGGTLADVARYIEEEKLVQYHQIIPPPDGRSVYTRGTETIVKMDFYRGRPVQLMVYASWISQLPSRKIVTVITLDGENIITIAVQGHLRCCSWNQVDLITMGVGP